MILRFAVVQALLLWQGGVPVSTQRSWCQAGTADALGSAAAQGTITARVTDALNAVGVWSASRSWPWN